MALQTREDQHFLEETLVPDGGPRPRLLQEREQPKERAARNNPDPESADQVMITNMLEQLITDMRYCLIR